MTRIAVVVVSAIVALSSLTLVSASGPTLPAAPSGLTQLVAGNTVTAGSWVNRKTVRVEFQVTGTGSPLIPQVEWRPASQTFTDQPTAAGSAVSPATGTTATVTVRVHGLRNGISYIWQARVVDADNNASAWTPFTTASQPALMVDTKRPARPRIVSPTNPHWGFWYNTRVERFHWVSTDAESGIAGYSYRLDHSATAQPGVAKLGGWLTVRHLTDGHWALHVWARDRAGNWSRPATYRFNLDTTPAHVALLRAAFHQFNPYAGQETWDFSVSRWASVVVNVMHSGQKAPVAVRSLGKLSPGTHAFTWDGKDSNGRMAPAGWYWLHVKTADRLGNLSNFAFGGILVRPVAPTPQSPYANQPESGKRIIISLSRQELYAYDGSTLVLSTPVTTGNPSLPTPVGDYHIFAKFSPYEFISPWPIGSPYYYPPSPVTWAMEFLSGGYFIHDAPWRSAYGPGTNGPGQPGTNYGGSHGCVNTPYSAMSILWSWTPMGTPVDVVP